ncbi:MAG: RAMP superfamily CRISPR-associated protein [Pseudanabaenaceae cyanobacterium]
MSVQQAVKPYDFVKFPLEKPKLNKPTTHDRYQPEQNYYHGVLELKLTAEKPIHTSTGVIMLGEDLGLKVPLVKPMPKSKDKRLIIQGSSLKGCIRSIYEAITNSTLAVIKDKNYPLEDRKPCKDKNKLCPASRVFGAMNWQSLLRFTDAECESDKIELGFIPSLYTPKYDSRKKPIGRKFYYHFSEVGTSTRGVSVQQAVQRSLFKSKIYFLNLKTEELGTLLISLGQHKNYPFALKIGAGKPIGMGSAKIEITAMQLYSSDAVKYRYTSYQDDSNPTLQGDKLIQKIEELTNFALSQSSSYVLKEQLQQLAEILQYPTNRKPPQGVY